VLCEVPRDDVEPEVDSPGGLGGEPVAVLLGLGGGVHDRAIDELRRLLQEELGHLLACRAAGPPQRDVELVAAGRERHVRETVAEDLLAAEGVELPDLEGNPRPALEGLGEVVHVHGVVPDRQRATGVGFIERGRVVSLGLAGLLPADTLPVAARLELPGAEGVLSETAVRVQAARANDLADDVQLWLAQVLVGEHRQR